MVRYVVFGLMLAAGLPGCGGGPIVCEDVALTNDDGLPDPAELQACHECQDACDGKCKVEDGTPQIYNCKGTTFTATDICPDWPETCEPTE